MNMKKKTVFLVIIAAIVLIISSSCFVVTKENEYTLIRQFGKICTVIDEAGISFKIPFIQSADTLPKEMMLYDLPQSDVITKDKKTMIADSYVLWRISDPLKFAQTLNLSITNAEGRIDAIVYNAIKSVISSMEQNDVITSREGGLQEDIMATIGNVMDQYGITIIAVETKQLDLPPDNKAAVYERMISERAQMAATYTAQGAADAQVIRNTTDMKIAIILSNAEAEAAGIIAEGEAEYMQILAEAYSDESRTDFYTYVRALEALQNSMTGESKTIILPADSPIAKLFLQ